MIRDCAAVVTVLAAAVAHAQPPDPFAFFRPPVAVAEADRARLDRGEPIAHPLEAHGAEVAVFAAVPIAIEPERLIAWIERIEALKRSAYVTEIHRFSDPPCLDDLAELTVDDEDLRGVPGATLDERQQAFRRQVLVRVDEYLAQADAASDAFARVLDHSVFLTRGLPVLADRLRHPLRPGVDRGFLYWSKEQIANRPIVIVTDVRIETSDDPRRPAVLIAGKEIFWTRYLRASLGVTALLRGRPSGPNYLVYVNRSEADAFAGFFDGFVRWLVQRRLADEAEAVLRGLRTRLESGDPPQREVSHVARRRAG